MNAHPPEPDDDPAAEWLAAQRRALEELRGGDGLEGLTGMWSQSLAEWWRAFGEAGAAALCREALDQTGAVAATVGALAAADGRPAPVTPWETGLAEWREAAQGLAAQAPKGNTVIAADAAVRREAAAAFLAEVADLAATLATQAWPAVATGAADASDPRALYESWLEAGDRAWLAHVSTERFARALGGLVNAAVAQPPSPAGHDTG